MVSILFVLNTGIGRALVEKLAKQKLNGLSQHEKMFAIGGVSIAIHQPIIFLVHVDCKYSIESFKTEHNLTDVPHQLVEGEPFN